MGQATRDIDRQAGGGGPAEEERTARLRAAIGKLGRDLRQTAAGAGLSPSQTSVLFTVVREGPMGLSEVARIEGLNPTMLSRIAGRLVELGLIRRQSSEADRRAAVVESTAAGRKLRGRVHEERTRILEGYLEEFEEEEREALWEALPVLEELSRRMRAAGA